MGQALAGVGGWGRSRLPESGIKTLIAADRLSICAPQHNSICDWLGLAGRLLQMGSSSPLVIKRTMSSSVTTNIQREVRYDWEEERPDQDYLKAVFTVKFLMLHREAHTNTCNYSKHKLGK